MTDGLLRSHKTWGVELPNLLSVPNKGPKYPEKKVGVKAGESSMGDGKSVIWDHRPH